jgi:ABC-type cobalamin transport system ATPase subunit
MADILHQRVRAQLALALLGPIRSGRALAILSQEARRSGLTGAEIDVALAGSSFEARTAAVIAYARALTSGINGDVTKSQTRARTLGVTDAELQTVAAEATEILGRSLS